MYRHCLNLRYHFIHLLDMSILKTLLMKKIRTNDLALEINKVSLEDDTNKTELEHEDHIMVTQSEDPNNKSKPSYKK